MTNRGVWRIKGTEGWREGERVWSYGDGEDRCKRATEDGGGQERKSRGHAKGDRGAVDRQREIKEPWIGKEK